MNIDTCKEPCKLLQDACLIAGKVKKLEKENTDLEKKVKEYEYLGIKELQVDAERLAKENNYLINQLEQAKELIRELIDMKSIYATNKEVEHRFITIAKAEQFLKEIEK